jgi:hypothetical protein
MTFYELINSDEHGLIKTCNPFIILQNREYLKFKPACPPHPSPHPEGRGGDVSTLFKGRSISEPRIV